jgi:hypothetical protein
VTEFDFEIAAALSSAEPIARARILEWIAATPDSDLSTLAKLYRLTGEGYYRIQPELGREPTCMLIQRYLLGCIQKGVADGEEGVQERFEAAESLHVWFKHVLEMDGTSAVLAQVASAVTSLYLDSDEDVRTAIETGFLEHALETTALRPYFQHWASDQRLKPAWNRALEWGKSHPDYMAEMFQRLQRTEGE